MNQEIAHSIAKNTTVLMGSQVITWVSSFVLMLFLPRYLGSDDYGRLYLALSIMMMGQTLIDFGGQYFIAKEVSRSRAQTPELMVNVITLRVILWMVFLLAMVAFSSLIGYSPIIRTLLLILGVAKLWEGAGKALASGFQGFELMQYPVRGAVVERLFLTVVGVSALLMGAHSIVIAAIMAVSTFLNFSVIVKCAPRIIPSVPRVRWHAVVDLLKMGTPYFLWSMFAVIYYRVDAIMLSLLTPEAVVGWYGAAYRLFDVFMFLPSIVAYTVLPVLSRLWGKEQETLVRTAQKSLELIVMAGIPISIAMFAFAEPIIQCFFGLNVYGPSVPVLQIFAASLLLVYVDFILSTTLFASDRQRQWTVVAFLAVMLNPLLNVVMIPYTQTHGGNGGIGAAIATLLTELFVMGAAIILMPKGILDGLRMIVPLKCVGAGALMAGSLMVMHTIGVPWMIQGIIGVGLYSLTLRGMNAIEPSELAFVRRLLSFRNLKAMFILEKEMSV